MAHSCRYGSPFDYCMVVGAREVTLSNFPCLLVDEKCQRRIVRQGQAAMKATATQITTLYRCGEQKSSQNAQHVKL